MTDDLSSGHLAGLPAPVYLVGVRYEHHATHSGYEGFGRWLGAPVWSPLRSTLARRVSRYRRAKREALRAQRPAAARSADRPRTAPPAITEHAGWLIRTALVQGPAALHMTAHGRSIYHVLYGDEDLALLRWALGRVRRHAVIATFHQSPAALAERPYILPFARKLSGVVLMSRSQRAFFESAVPADRIFVVPHGVDTEFFSPPSRLTEEPVCLTVGSHTRDFATLAETIRLMWQTEPRVRWLVVGSRRDPASWTLPEDPRVEFLQGLSDDAFREAHRRARVAVLSLREATANNALLEALACGLPVVATDVGGVREYLDEASGVACAPANPAALAREALRVLRDSTVATRMATAARHRALRFDYRVVAEDLRRVYRAVLGR
jgi:glycosyltransferase involved in cell wall biosynthesis